MQVSTTTSQREQMFSFIEQWKASGISQQTFCREHEVPYHSFHYWYKVYREHQGRGAARKPAFVAVHLDGVPFGRPLVELVLPGGKRLLFHHQPSLDFLKALL